MKFDPRYELLTSRVLAALRPVLIAFLVMNGAALGQGSKTPTCTLRGVLDCLTVLGDR